MKDPLALTWVYPAESSQIHKAWVLQMSALFLFVQLTTENGGALYVTNGIISTKGPATVNMRDVSFTDNRGNWGAAVYAETQQQQELTVVATNLTCLRNEVS